MEKSEILNIVKKAKNSFLKTMNLNNDSKNLALEKIAQKIEEKRKEILFENQKDLSLALKLVEEEKLTKSNYERLKLDDNKLNTLIKGLNELKTLPDPVNQTIWQKELDDNLILKKVSAPIGLIGVIFEARPDCFIQISSLIIKSGNCAILKGGVECQNTNTIFSKIVNDALGEIKTFPQNVINLLYSREDIKEILLLDKYIDLIIPRGGNNLVKFIKENTKIPVLGHSDGICHIFVDKENDFENVKNIIIDSKTQYPSACNSVETVLADKNYPYINNLKNELTKAGIKIIENPDSFSKEYGDKILAFKIVENIDCAIEHINTYSSHHTDSILSDNQENIEKFMNLVDSACVFSNCSTRFSDGFRFGFGAEVGISTNKTHARGPVGLEGLTIYKYKLQGSNNIVAPYATGEKEFKHKFI